MKRYLIPLLLTASLTTGAVATTYHVALSGAVKRRWEACAISIARDVPSGGAVKVIVGVTITDGEAPRAVILNDGENTRAANLARAIVQAEINKAHAAGAVVLTGAETFILIITGA